MTTFGQERLFDGRSEYRYWYWTYRECEFGVTIISLNDRRHMLGWRDLTRNQRLGGVFLLVIFVGASPFLMFAIPTSLGDRVWYAGLMALGFGVVLDPQWFRPKYGTPVNLAAMPRVCRILRHYLTPAGAIAEMPPRARLLAEYFASIVVDATSNLDDPPTVRCRRWPKHRRCAGIVMSYTANDEHDSIYRHCPVCHDNGVIRGWQHTFWDGLKDDDSVRA